MENPSKIDTTLLFRMIEKMRDISLNRNERKILSNILVRWETEHSGEDERRLAYAFAYVHTQLGRDSSKNDKTAAEGLTNEALDQPEKEWSKVIDANGGVVDGTSDVEVWAAIFYSALLRVRPVTLTRVLQEELKATKGVSVERRDLEGVFYELHEQQLSALCFSGGGIRSATFGLGIVQALARHELLGKFDYLSTVSGGGYLGSWLSAWVCREHKQRPNLDDRQFGIDRVQQNINCREIPEVGDPNPEPPQLQHLREYSNYMSPKTGLLSADTWTLGAIYARNLLLNLLIFVPLIAAVLALPRFLFQAMFALGGTPDSQFAMLLAGIAFGCLAISFVISRLPSKADDDEESVKTAGTLREKVHAFLNTDPGILIVGVLPLLVSGFLASSLWIQTFMFGSQLENHSMFSSLKMESALPYFLIVSGAAYVVGLVLFVLIKFRKAERDLSAAVAAFVSSLIGGLLLWVAVYKLFPFALVILFDTFGPYRSEHYLLQLYSCVAIPVFLLVVLIAASIFVGLTSRTATDEDREWLARYGALVLIAAGVWILVNAITLFGPSLLQWLFRFDWRGPFVDGLPAYASTVIATVSALVALLGGFSEKGLVRDEPYQSRTSKFLAYAPRIASVIFLIFIFIMLAYIGTLIMSLSGYASTRYHVTVLQEVGLGPLTLMIIALAVIGVVMACFVSVNKFSLHGAYRDRLVRAYLGASNESRKQNTFIGFDDKDNLELHELENQRPLHVINATVNLVGGKNLAWQNRKAASFTMSPLHCGSWAVKGYRKSREYCRSATSGKALRLGTAMAISGAAANPNMGYYSSSVVTFLMSFFNIRLGWWLGNTGKPGSGYHWFGLGRRRYFEKVGPSIAVLPLLNETLGRTDENKRFLMVTDGGHFENLALYEMVLRRCKLIVLSDGAADESFKFGEIANAIQKCKVDLGVDIKLLGTMCIYPRGAKLAVDAKRSRFALGQITYPERYLDPETNRVQNYRGWLLYMRPTYYENEPRDVRYYAESNSHFPHQSTGDQMYDEKQFEAYRSLGFLTMEEILGDSQPNDLNELFDNLLASI